jgi:hypothetical protein
MTTLVFIVVACVISTVVWNAIWTFYLAAALYAIAGVSKATDYRKKDRRFKTGFKDNETDQSDLAGGIKLIIYGAVVGSLGYLLQDYQQILSTLPTSGAKLWDDYGWQVCALILGTLLTLAVIDRLRRNAKHNHTETKTTSSSERIGKQRSEQAVRSSRDHAVSDAQIILVYVGKSDGQLRAREKEIIAETLDTLFEHYSEINSVKTSVLAGAPAPTVEDFKLAVSKFSLQDNLAQMLLLEAAQKIVGTQKSVHAAEQEALKYLEAHISARR